jgi:hypothetical protein
MQRSSLQLIIQIPVVLGANLADEAHAIERAVTDQG